MSATSITSWLACMGPTRVRSLFAGEPESAAAWVRVLAAEGLADAQLCYGRMLLEGTGTPKNQPEALLWFGRAATQGNLDAVNLVGRCIEHGWGTAIDLPHAAEHYHRAADAGHAWAQYNLGHLYLDGMGVARDAGEAYRYYRLAADQQHARAMNLVGRCCEEGWGTVKGAALAADWYRRSAEGGYFRGQYNWATVLLRHGRVDDAVLWFERAANHGTTAVRDTVLKLADSLRSVAPIGALADRLRGRAEALGA